MPGTESGGADAAAVSRRGFLVGIAAAALIAPIAGDPRSAARAAGYDPDEIVSFGQPIITESAIYEAPECPIWHFFDPARRAVIERYL